ncbi:MAG TPA: flagellar hook-associated protein FlgL [Rugosimonospora sp.]|nr:flagellar hook-associated protein FlgL [Rugosimonospora sp.]
MTGAFRVTQRSLSETALAGLQTSLTRLGTLQEQMTSGKLLNKPSDSPTGTIQAMDFRADIRTQEQYSRNADDGVGWLGIIDSTLGTMGDQVQRARELTLQGISSGAASSPEGRQSIATEIDSIRNGLIAGANTTYLGRPVFGGTTSGSVAYDANANYVGDSGSVNRTVGNGVSVQVDASGPATFGTGTGQIFTVLAMISNDLKTNPGALTADLAQLDTASSTMLAQRADVGARYNRITQMKQNADNRTIDLKTQLSDVEDIDLPKTITELQLQQTAYQAALSATAKVLQPSLMDFLK